MADIIAMFNRWAKSGLSEMLSWVSSSLDGSASSSMEPTRRSAMDDFQRIMRMLPRIEAVLEDAEDRDIQDRAVKLWLSELRLLAYDIDDVVDAYEYEVLRARMEARVAEEACCRGKRKRGHEDHHHGGEQEEGRNVLASSSSQVPSISDGMAEKLREIRERFNEIERDRKALRLREEDGERRFVTPQRPPPTSSHIIHESNIIGRENDKKMIVDLLLSDSKLSNNSHVRNKITVLPIIGMGGVGKTTLAQLIYNDPKIRHHFCCRAWINVPEDFDVVLLTREIYRSIANRTCEMDVGFDNLQKFTKRELLKSNRTFLVLDDVWHMEQCQWEALQVPFHGAGIVSILITTRSKKVTNVMGTMKPYSLDILSKEAGWRLFQQHALCDDANLIKIGHDIVRKCGGLPLAIRVLGSHLRFELDEDKWTSILESELWDLDPGKTEILPALRLSYQGMPIHLKPCFRYCSMFPKNYRLNKNRLVWLWMAHGYIRPKTASKTMEKIGREYFDELLERSLVQPTGDKDFFKMHDLIIDLAVSIFGEEFSAMNLEDDKQNKFISNNVRHLVIYDQRTRNGTQQDNLVRPFPRKNIALRSIFYHCQNITDVFQLSDSMRLRTLHISLQNYDPTMLIFLSVIAPLKHLCYFYIGNGTSRFYGYKNVAHLSLFNSFHEMYNLQVLDLVDCNQPLILPASINNLINLRHLILPYYSFMPCGISKLTSLQTLKYVIVKDGSEECGGLSEIEGLASLTESCSITNIYYTIDVEGVKKANVNKKEHIQRLRLDWQRKDYKSLSFDVDINFDGQQRKVEQSVDLAEVVLEALRPHNSLKELEIYNYPGVRFPLWLGDRLYSKLRNITLDGCNNWIGSGGMLDKDLPCLQSISIISCAMLKVVTIQSSSLRSLLVQDCHELSTLHGLCNLHMLEKLEIRICHNFLISVEERLPSMLQFVCFEDCWKLTAITGLQYLHSLEELKLKKCPKLQFSVDEQLSTIPGAVKIIDCPGLREWCQRYGFEFIQEVSTIEDLTIRDCNDVVLSYGSSNLVSLQTLYICKFYGSEFPKDEWIPCSLNTLHLMSCRELKFFPPYQNLSALKLLKIWQCKNLKYLCGLQMMKSLEKLEIIECPKITFSPVQRLPSKLQYLQISNCSKLMWLPGLQQLISLRDLKLYDCHELMLPPLEQLPFMHQVQFEIINCSKLGEWCRRYNLSYNNKVSSKTLFARSSQQIKLWLDEASVLFDNVCVLDYDEDILETERWPAFRLLGFYVCSSVHLKSIKFGNNFSGLRKLRIWNCSHLEVIFELYNPTSLQEMDISNCPNLHCLKSRRSFLLKQAYFSGPFVECVDLKISKCPKLRLDEALLLHPRPDVIEIRACPQLQEWCQENNIDYFQD